MNTYQILILLSSLVIFSYLFDLLAKKTLFPSILLLLITGVAIKYISLYLDFKLLDVSKILPVLGNVGLILIVLEGGLELKYEKEKLSIINKSLSSALFPMLLIMAGITFLFMYFFDTTFYLGLLNSIPLAVISSAIAIPSAASLSPAKKEFIIYESSFSDIIGIVLANFVLLNSTFTIYSFLELGLEIIIILVISLVCCLAILFLLGKITMHIKYYLLFSVMILVYAIGKSFHLSSLIVILAVGLFLNNTDLLKSSRFKRIFVYDTLKEDLHQLVTITSESAFLICTFFFLIFGYSLDLSELMDMEVFYISMIIIAIIFVTRYVYLKWVIKTSLLPEVYIAPRGLISILLFFSIPTEKWVSYKENGIVLMVIIASSILMTIGLLSTSKEKNIG